MLMNGGHSIESKFKSADKALRIAGLIIPLLMIIYGFMVKFGFIQNPNYSSDLALYIISIAWIIAGVLQLPYKKTLIPPLAKVIIYHFLTIAYFVFVSGFNVPFVAVWVLNLIGITSYFRLSSIWASLLIFILAATFESIIVIQDNFQIYVTQLVSIISVSALGAVIIAVINSHRIDQEELLHSRNQELLRREQILTIINSLTDCVLAVNSAGKIEIYNSAALNFFDTNENLVGKNIEDLVSLFDAEDKKFYFKKELKTTSSNLIRDDLENRNNGESSKIELNILPIKTSYSQSQNSQENGFVILIRDITKEKTLEEERDEFISVVSHELRTPVAIAEGAISNLQVMIEREVSKDKLTQSAESAYSEIIFLANMVNDLSTLSRAERGVGSGIEDIDVKKLGESIFNKYQNSAAEKNLSLDLDLGVNLGTVRTSRLYVEELLQNFMTNALKYTSEGKITIQFKDEGDQVSFAVKDSGIGISKSDQKNVFRKFYRSEDYRTRETGGTGLGLYVATKLAQKIDTKIKLTSRLNHGSTFSFSIPKVKED